MSRMFYHFIVIASSYYEGARIGFHKVSDTPVDKNLIDELLTKITLETERSDFGIHSLITEEKSWKSVCKKDSFFSDVLVADDLSDFIEFLTKDKNIDAIDIAKFFLSYMSISQLKLQKLVYLAYATHLTRTSKKMFEEEIVAYRYGPVIEEVYDKYKMYGREEINDNADVFTLEDIKFPQSLARISLSKDGEEIIESLMLTMDMYGDKTASQLVTITHAENGPWDNVYQEYQNNILSDELILSKHYYEQNKV